ncbi:MAG: DNA repair protein RecO [Planctomycetota bacterium]
MSRIVCTRGLVLRRIAYSNTSQIVTVFGRDEGILTLIAKGSLRLARRSSSFPSPFDLACWYDIVYRVGSGEMHTAVEGRLIEGFGHVRRHLGCFLDTCLALEVLGKMFSPGDPHPEILRGALSYLKLLAVPGGRRALRVHFHSQLLKESGLAPHWGRCGECGVELEEAGPALRAPVGALCPGCRRTTDERAALDVFRYLDAEAALPWGQVPSLQASPRVLQECWRILKGMLLYHLERPPRSLRYVRQ